MPNNPIAIELIRKAGTPVAAPSANASGRPSPTEAAHVERDLGGRIDMILDGGATKIGIESTVLDITNDAPVILRPGWVTSEQIADTIGNLQSAAKEEELRRSPGTRHRHYSPRARVVLIERDSPQSIERICKNYLKASPVAFIGHTRFEIDDRDFYSVILENSAEDYARSIYRALREMDERGASVIIVEAISETGEGAAVMDRLRRAASEIR
jgi:L-threonylcarbamoyladenylate synthase